MRRQYGFFVRRDTIANPAFIVCNACLKVARFVSVYAVFARKMNDGERSWMR
jgi:hypothetical protein